MTELTEDNNNMTAEIKKVQAEYVAFMTKKEAQEDEAMATQEKIKDLESELSEYRKKDSWFCNEPQFWVLDCYFQLNSIQ